MLALFDIFILDCRVWPTSRSNWRSSFDHRHSLARELCITPSATKQNKHWCSTRDWPVGSENSGCKPNSCCLKSSTMAFRGCSHHVEENQVSYMHIIYIIVCLTSKSNPMIVSRLVPLHPLRMSRSYLRIPSVYTIACRLHRSAWDGRNGPVIQPMDTWWYVDTWCSPANHPGDGHGWSNSLNVGWGGI